MNLTITKDQIIAGLQAVQNVVSTRTTLPILSNVLLRAEDGKVEFTATDLDVTVACTVEAKVTKPGATTVPVKKLFGIVRELQGEIDIETDEKNVTSIRSGGSSGGRMRELLQALDTRLLLWVNGHHSPVCDALMWWASQA